MSQVSSVPFYQLFHSLSSSDSSSPPPSRLMPFILPPSPPSPLSPLMIPESPPAPTLGMVPSPPRNPPSPQDLEGVRANSPMDCEEGSPVLVALEDPRRKYKRLLSQEPVSWGR